MQRRRLGTCPVVTNTRFGCVPRVAGSAPSPSRPHPFHFANRALVTSKHQQCAASAAGFRLRLDGGRCASAHSARRFIPPSAPLAHPARSPTRRPKPEFKGQQGTESQMKAKTGIELVDRAFAEPCLATWLIRPKAITAILKPHLPVSFGNEDVLQIGHARSRIAITWGTTAPGLDRRALH